MKFDVDLFCYNIRKAPRLNELLDKFEKISIGMEQVPLYVPKTNLEFIKIYNHKEILLHENIYSNCLGIFFRHAIASIPYLSEEILRTNLAIRKYAVWKKHDIKNPLTYWETSSADGTRARTLGNFSKGIIVTLTDSPNFGNEYAFNKSCLHSYSYFYRGAFIDICPEYLKKQTISNFFKDGFDIIWENTTFQMYGKNRYEQTYYISKSLKNDGIVLFLEKMSNKDLNLYSKMEKIKDEFKSDFFVQEQIENKKTDILKTMENGQVTLEKFVNEVSKVFKYGYCIWNSSNFYEIAASNSKKNIEYFIGCLDECFVPNEFRIEKFQVYCLWK